ncbi:MAG TPA: secretin and TonB N-terminal domain-containing protein, partial [Anaeromyxobacter sp.]|nr:secretin and TonB N-terminal domain-containing protein [Anaeromyxobacter sp.]
MLPLLLAALLLQPAPEAPGPGAPPAPPRDAPVRSARKAPTAPPALPAPPAPAASGQGALAGDWPAKPSGKTVSLDDTVALDDALQEIAKVAGWNVVLNTGRTGNVQLVLKLRRVPVEDALRSALAGTGLQATRHGDTVVIAPAFRAEPRPTLSGLERPSGKKFTGEFHEEDVGSALQEIANAAGLSIVFPPGVDCEVTAVFNGTPVEDALRAVLAQADLTAELQGSVLMVRPQAAPFPGNPRDRNRLAQKATREAERELRRGQRDREDERAGKGNDRVSNGDITIRAGEQVRDVVALRGDVRLEPGASARDVVAILGSVTMGAGSRAREATAIVGDVEVGPGAEVEKNVTSVGGHVRPDPSAEIGGEQTSVGLPEASGLGAIIGSSLLSGHRASPIWLFAQALAKFALYFALGLLLVALFPRRVDGVAASMVASPVKSILTGLLGLVAVPLLCLLLVVTVIGIPLVAVVALLVLAAGVLGFTALSFHVGRSLPVGATRNTWVLQLAVGTAIVVALTQIPFVGTLAWIA